MEKPKAKNPVHRPVPFVCRLFLFMAITYYGILNLLFLGMLVFSARIRQAAEPWYTTDGIDNMKIILIILLGLAILTMCTSGIVLMLKKRRGGYFIYLAGAVILWVADFFLLEFDWIRYLINSGFIFILGVIHFSGRCYGKPLIAWESNDSSGNKENNISD